MKSSAAVAVEELQAARPLLKWAGGKTSLLPKILERLPKKIGTYFEPFAGGAAAFFALAAEKRFKKARLSDSNEELIGTYRQVATSWGFLLTHLRIHETKHSEEHFYATRAQDPFRLSGPQRAARMIYLNKTCFNGLYRVNKKGEFNVPFGAYKNPMICDEDNLRAAGHLLRDTGLFVRDFEDGIQLAERGDAVYFDPPYVPASVTANFTAYSKDGFGSEEQQRLRDVALELDDRGVHVLLSNSDTPFVRKLYKGFVLEKVKARRAINSAGAKRGEVGELLILGLRSARSVNAKYMRK